MKLWKELLTKKIANLDYWNNRFSGEEKYQKLLDVSDVSTIIKLSHLEMINTIIKAAENTDNIIPYLKIMHESIENEDYSRIVYVNFDYLVGTHVDQASDEFKNRGIQVRVTKKGNDSYMGISNLDHNRLNVHINENNIITKVGGLG